jgi:hypothetical protein
MKGRIFIPLKKPYLKKYRVFKEIRSNEVLVCEPHKKKHCVKIDKKFVEEVADDLRF